MHTKHLQTLTLAVLALALAAPSFAQRGNDAERKSKNGLAEGKVGDIAVVVDYSRPEVKERAIFGALVPWGEIWRTGANEATTVSFSADVMVEGKRLAAGKYALLTIPGEKSWTVVFNTATDLWGANKYDTTLDALRVEVVPSTHEHTEVMTFTVEGDALVLRWADRAVAVKLAPAT